MKKKISKIGISFAVVISYACDIKPQNLTDCNGSYQEIYPAVTVERVLNSHNFLDYCWYGGAGQFNKIECQKYQHCVSTLRHNESHDSSLEFIELDFDEAVNFIKEKMAINSRTESRESCIGDRCQMRSSNIENACDAVVSTYNPAVVGNSIFSHIPELNYRESQELGELAVVGYGECMCALHNALGIKDDMSIGYCVGSQYMECEETAFCGREIAR